MKILLVNTGVHFINLGYEITKSSLKNSEIEIDFDLDYIWDLIKNNFTPLSLDCRERDFARIYWRFDKNKDSLKPLLAIDTTKGKEEDGFITDYDADDSFPLYSDFDKFFPGNSEFIANWLMVLHRRRNAREEIDNNNQSKTSLYSYYRNFLRLIYNNQNLINILSEKEFEGVFGEFSFKEPDDYIDVNLYLDLGNSRSVAMFFEDKSPNFNTGIHKFTLQNYTEFFDGNIDYTSENESLIFDSFLEFKTSQFRKTNTITKSTNTFKWPSCAVIGEEASDLSSKIRELNIDTGLSSPKRYLWDDSTDKGPWYYSNKSKEITIDDEILKYISPTDSDSTEDEFPIPTKPKYPRRSFMIFYLLEILNQVYRQINSFKHREQNKTLFKRILSRVVLTYPSGWPEWYKKRFLKQIEKACYIFSKFIGIEEPSVDFALDEASSSQIVFLESEIKKHNNNIDLWGENVLFTDDNNNFIIASIDIGGGTTDMMVANYNMNNFNRRGGFEGKINLVDSTNYGGDDLLKEIVEKFVIPSIDKSWPIPEKLFKKLYGTENAPQNFKLKILNILYKPFALHILSSLMQGKPINRFKNKQFTKIYKNEISTSLKNVSNKSFEDFIDKLKEKDWDLEQSYKNEFQFPTTQKIINYIKQSKLCEQVLRKYSSFIGMYKPSFVILSGKISSLPLISDVLKKFLVCSPDRLISLHNYFPGSWYPFKDELGKIHDPKTSVVVGAAISDISTNANIAEGCYVSIRKDALSNINFVGTMFPSNNTYGTFMNRKILMGPNDKKMNEKIEITSRALIIAFRNINNEEMLVNPIYTIKLKNGFYEDKNDPPKLLLRRNKNDRGLLEIVHESACGKVIKDDRNIDFDPQKHLLFKEKTMLTESYYLDTGDISYSRSNMNS